MSFDHTSAASQLALNLAYVGQTYTVGTDTVTAAVDDVPVELRVEGAGVERRLHVLRGDFAALPEEGTLVTDPSGLSWRLIRNEPGPPGIIVLRIVSEMQ